MIGILIAMEKVYCGVCASRAGEWCVACGSCLGVLVRWLSRVRSSAFSIRTHSQRETWVSGPCPTGLLTARVLGDGGSAPPRVSTLSSSCVSPFPLPARLSRAPRPGCDSPSWPPLGASPSRRKACLLRWLICSVYIMTGQRSHIMTGQRSHEITRSLCSVTPLYLFSLTVEGCCLTFTLLLVHVHQFNRLALDR